MFQMHHTYENHPSRENKYLQIVHYQITKTFPPQQTRTKVTSGYVLISWDKICWVNLHGKPTTTPEEIYSSVASCINEIPLKNLRSKQVYYGISFNGVAQFLV